MKTVPQSIWPVSVFGLGFLLIIMGLSGVASIQETRRIHQQILAVEDTYRQIENVVEGIRSDTSRVAVLRRDRLLERDASASAYAVELAGLRAKTELSLDQLSSLRPQQSSRPVERLKTALGAYLKTVDAEFQQPPAQTKARFLDDGFGSETMPIFAITEELGKLNEENFESRRRELSQSVVHLQNDIWETMLTALVLGGHHRRSQRIPHLHAREGIRGAPEGHSELAEERLRHLSQQLVSSQEQERKALSRELHDEIGQLLTALRMELGNLERSRSTPGGEPDPHLDQAKKLAESTLRTTRDIAMGLRPAMLDVLWAGARTGMAGARIFPALQHTYSPRSGRRSEGRARSPPDVPLSHRAGRPHQLRPPRSSQEHSCQVGGFQRQAGRAGGRRWRGVRPTSRRGLWPWLAWHHRARPRAVWRVVY